jgi:hypothetical protein
MILLLSLLLVFTEPSLAKRAAPPTHEVVVKKGDVFQGVKFPPGTLLRVYADDKTVASATISADFTLRGVAVKAGSTLSLWDNGVLMELSPKEGGFTHVYNRDGKLESMAIYQPQAVQGFRYVKGAQIYFHPSGKVSRGIRLEAQEKDGLFLAQDSEIHFFDSGKWSQLTLAKESRFGDLYLVPSPNPGNIGETEFWPNGKLKEGILGRSATVDGYPCAPGRISLFESGKVKTLVLGADRKVSVNGYPKDAHAGDTLNFSEAGLVIGWGGK